MKIQFAMKFSSLLLAMILACGPARAALSPYQLEIRGFTENDTTVFKSCEMAPEGVDCTTIGNPLGYSSETLKDVVRFCQTEKAVVPFLNLVESGVLVSVGFVLGMAVGAPGGPVGVASGAVAGVGAGGWIANKIEPKVNVHEFSDGISKIKAIRSEKKAYLSIDRFLTIQRGLTACLSSYDHAQEQMQRQIERNKYVGGLPIELR